MKKILVFIFICFFASSVFALEKVEINTASLKELDKITGIGPAMAQRIIDARPFSSLDDLLKVKGIGEKTLAKIKTQGLACVDCKSPETGSLQVSYPEGIIFNELLPSPEGTDETEEWFELKNTNNFEVDLSGWQVKDAIGTNSIFTISKKIPASGYLVFKRPETKIMLNNDNDGLRLLAPGGEIKDSVDFSKAQKGQSYNRINNNWQWSSALTPGKENIIKSISVSSSSKTTKNKSSGVRDSANLTEAGPLLSSASAPIKNSSNNFNVFLIAFILAIISAASVLALKIMLKRVDKSKFLS